MNIKYIAIVAVVAAALVGTTAITADSAFATKSKDQATAQTNSCGNGELPLNVGCQTVGSQVQGEENEVAIAADQSFPTIQNNEHEPK